MSTLRMVIKDRDGSLIGDLQVDVPYAFSQIKDTVGRFFGLNNLTDGETVEVLKSLIAEVQK